MTSPNVQTISVTFTSQELEKMLKNALSGGSVEVLITINHEVILR